jgi:hypothetical protein
MMRSNTQSNFYHLSGIALQEEYFAWLCELVDVGQQGCSYEKLMRALHERDFFWSVPNDDNRAFEGKELRCKFCEDYNIVYNYDEFSMATSMLELIIALAYRCESLVEGQDNNLSVKEWFWKMMSNTGLDSFTDEVFDKKVLGDWCSVEQILNKIIDRSYNRSGKGGLFPLRFAKKDQRKVELWYQMCAYLLENYYEDDEIL